MRLRFTVVLSLAFVSVFAAAQQTLNNQSIVKMHDAGMGDDLIVATINAQAGTYSTAIDDLIVLKKAGIDEKVITAMVTKTSNLVSTGPPPPPLAEAVGKPRVFLVSASHGPSQNAARDQSMEMSKDFERDCPGVRISLNQANADYTISLNHIEIGLFVRDNQFQIADHSGDLISKTKEGGSISTGVKKACAAVLTNWQQAHPELLPLQPPPPATK